MSFIRRLQEILAPPPPPMTLEQQQQPTPQVIHEAEREDMKRDTKQLDSTLLRLAEQKNIFAALVDEVVRDVNAERRQRRAHEKTTSRSRKT